VNEIHGGLNFYRSIALEAMYAYICKINL